MLINRLNHPLFHDTARVWTVNTNLSFEPIIKYLFGCKGTNFSTKFQIYFSFFFRAQWGQEPLRPPTIDNQVGYDGRRVVFNVRSR